MKEKMLSKIEIDRLNGKVSTLTKQVEKLEKELNVELDGVRDDNQPEKTKRETKWTPFPPEKENPYETQEIERFHMREGTTLYKTYKAHDLGISKMAMHPRKSILATASDDATWRLWNIPEGKLLMGGEGHTDWLSGIDFHPKGNLLATSSADGTVRLWDFAKNGESIALFKDHTQVVWDVKFNETGEFLSSCSMDQSIKIWDLEKSKCRHSMRGHVDSVNSICFVPYTNMIVSCSGDKTISVWDMRTTHCAQTYMGHKSAINRVDCNIQGSRFVSCDADGIVFLWDYRMAKELKNQKVSDHDLNAVKFEKSGKTFLAGGNDMTLRLFSDELECKKVLAGHEDAILDVCFD